MNWSDERYVKVYTRDSANWKMLPWEAKAVWLLLLRKLDGAGIVDTGSHDRNKVLALVLDVPSDVVAKAIPALLADGTLVEVERGLMAPNFIDSQEARKTDAQSKRDQRQRIKDQRSATQRLEVTEEPVRLLSDHVRPCPTMSVSSTAQHSSAQNKEASAKKPRAPKEPDAFAVRLNAIFASSMAGATYKPSVADWVHLADLKKISAPDDIATRWERGLRNRASGTYPGVSTWAQLASKWNDLAVNGKSAPAERAPICEVIS